MHISQIEFWVPRLDLLLSIVAALLVVRNKLWRELPAFSWYLFFGVVSALIFWTVRLKFRGLYFVAYYSIDITYKLLNVWVTFEIYSRLMNAFPVLRQFAWKVLWIAGVILLATCALMYELTNYQGVSALMTALFTMGRSLRVVQLGLLSVTFLIARMFKLRLRRYYAFIALGLVIIDSSEFITLSMFFSDHASYFVVVDHIRMIISVSVTLMWIVVLYLGEGEIATKAAPGYAALPIAEINQWNLALSEARGQ